MKVFFCILIVLVCAGAAYGQFKSQADAQQDLKQSMLRPFSSNSLLSWFDPNRFSMRQSVGMSFLSSGLGGLSLASYTNSMRYQVSDPLQVRMDFTLQGAPFGSSQLFSGANLNKLFISRAELDYRLSQNSFLSIQFQQSPYQQWLTNDPFRAYRSSSLMWGDE